MIPFAIAGVQMAVPAGQSNVAAMVQRVDICMARFPWVQMILFSELACCGPVPTAPAALPGAEEQALQAAAVRHGVWLVTGSTFERGAEGQLHNTASVINPAGEVVARYRKMFPFLPYEHGVEPGTEFCVFDVPDVGRFGLSICFDMWFPETSRTLTAMGAEVLLHPVLTGTIDRDVELAMARSTAAQFQAYVFDINGLLAGGVGRSCVVDPTGTVIHQAAGGEEIIPVEIDLSQVRRQREIGARCLGQMLKSFRDRKVDFRVYDRQAGIDAYLHTLGPLVMPGRAGAPRAPSPTGPTIAGTAGVLDAGLSPARPPPVRK
ncbi:MAG: carbon-nitrogen hydrolase family protein [Rubrivivax sp.]